jgi:CheY-like chemotaxis protein
VLPVVHDGPSVVLAAPEGEWHVLPSRMAAAAARGARTRVLGPGLPAEHLQRFLEAREPDLVALSVTMSTNLLSAARSIAAAQTAGIPVLVGGHALGADDRRARALGADGWAASAGSLGTQVPTASGVTVELPYEALVADAVDDGVLLLALERQAGGSTWVRAMNGVQRRHSLDDLRWITRHAAAALACEDATVLDDLLRWLDALLSDRGVPAHVLPDGTGYLADALEAETPRVADLVREAGGRLR